MSDIKVGKQVRLADGRTGWVNRLLDADGAPTRTRAHSAIVLLDAEDWTTTEATVPVDTLTLETP